VLAIASIPLQAAAADDPALKEQIRILKQRIDELNSRSTRWPRKRSSKLRRPRRPQPSPQDHPRSRSSMLFMKDYKEKGGEPKLAAFLKGFLRHAGCVLRRRDQGHRGNAGLPLEPLRSTPNPNSAPGARGLKGGPAAGSAICRAVHHKSQIGYRFSPTRLPTPARISSCRWRPLWALTAQPGLRTSYVQQSNAVTGAIGLGDTFVGLQDKGWGSLKFGHYVFRPYKKSTDRLIPSRECSEITTVVMGNTGRATIAWNHDAPRPFDHLRVAETRWPLQCRPAGVTRREPHLRQCDSVGRLARLQRRQYAGSGNLLLNCDDGGFSDAYSIDLRFETGPFYAH